ncbi:hypothetical protein AB0G49_36385, partial [Streptomyces longwoodensis]|uniref:hypothetical protein n=1 Tax=Streptomyces longwoodensis TaxID=68231 RepID=UPI00340ADB8C
GPLLTPPSDTFAPAPQGERRETWEKLTTALSNAQRAEQAAIAALRPERAAALEHVRQSDRDASTRRRIVQQRPPEHEDQGHGVKCRAVGDLVRVRRHGV